VADEDHALETERLHHRLDVGGESADGPHLTLLAGFAVAGLVERDDAVVRGERLDLVLPVCAVAAPAVQEDEGGVALAADFADDRQSVGGADGSLHRLGVGPAADRCRPQEREAEE
jgi:hypothetical protein